MQKKRQKKSGHKARIQPFLSYLRGVKPRNRINQARVDKLYVRLLAWLTAQGRYRSADCSQADAAAELGVSVYTLSSAIKQSCEGRYSDIVNNLRLRDACEMLSNPALKDMTIEEIGLSAGYASRQAFYTAFARRHSVTPQQFRTLQQPQ